MLTGGRRSEGDNLAEMVTTGPKTMDGHCVTGARQLCRRQTGGKSRLGAVVYVAGDGGGGGYRSRVRRMGENWVYAPAGRS